MKIHRVGRSVVALCLLTWSLESYSDQRISDNDLLAKTLNWIERSGKGRMPTRLELERLFPHASPFGPDGAPYPSSEEFYLALKNYSAVQGVQLRLLTVRAAKPSEAFLSALRQEANHLILEWVRTTGRLPALKDFGTAPGQISILYDRLVSANAYAPGPAAQGTGLFASSQEFWRQFQAYAENEGVAVRLTPLRFRSKGLPQDLQDAAKREALSLVTQWIHAQGRIPSRRDFGTTAGLIPLDYGRLTAAGIYAAGARFHSKALFANSQDFWLQLKDEAERQGLTVRLQDVTFRGALSPKLRETLRQEALQCLLQWVAAHQGRLPEAREFGMGPSQVPLSYKRLAAIAEYAPGKSAAHSALFASSSELWAEFAEFAASQGVDLKAPEPRKTVKAPPPPRPPKLSKTERKQQQALSFVLLWMTRQKRLPKAKDFGLEPQQIPLSYSRLFPNAKSTEKAKFLFASAQEFWIKLKALGELEKIRIRLLYVRFPTPLEDETRRQIQEEALTLILAWQKQAQRPPEPSDFGKQAIAISYERLIGAPEYQDAGSHIFSSKEEYERALQLKEESCQSLF